MPGPPPVVLYTVFDLPDRRYPPPGVMSSTISDSLYVSFTISTFALRLHLCSVYVAAYFETRSPSYVPLPFLSHFPAPPRRPREPDFVVRNPPSVSLAGTVYNMCNSVVCTEASTL